MREHVTLCLLPACPKGNGSVTESPTARSACTSSCPAAPAGRVCLRAPKHPHFKPPPPPPPHLGHGRGCLQPGGFVVGTDFRKPLHVIWSDAGICEVNAIKQKKKKEQSASERARSPTFLKLERTGRGQRTLQAMQTGTRQAEDGGLPKFCLLFPQEKISSGLPRWSGGWDSTFPCTGCWFHPCLGI